ncbi:uncharacterized protein DMENIID0001_123250 [Sergentomyia squamirostris]
MDGDSSLKRCSSAPLINNIQTMTSSQATSTSSMDISPSPAINIFARTRRYSASYSPLAGSAMSPSSGPRLTPRVSQLRQEECIDINSREVNHEREIHSAMQMSQSCEDLRIVTEAWSFKNDDLTNPLHVNLPTGGPLSCSSPSPTSRGGGASLRYQVMSPSPTRKTFATRRSMSPNAMRPSTLCPVKRKFDLDDNSSTCSPPPYKKMFLESSRGSSPVCQTPSPICPSPDSGTYEGRITPKFFVSKLFTTSSVSSPSSAAHSPATNSSNSGASVGSASSGVTVDETMTLIVDKDFDSATTKQDITDEECASITRMSTNLDHVAERLEVLKEEEAAQIAGK